MDLLTYLLTQKRQLWRWQTRSLEYHYIYKETRTGTDNGKIDSSATVCAPLPGGRHRRSFVPQDKIDSSHRGVVRCWPWPGASPPGPQGQEKVINHEILIIKGT